jgi:hypothetical protein
MSSEISTYVYLHLEKEKLRRPRLLLFLLELAPTYSFLFMAYFLNTVLMLIYSAVKGLLGPLLIKEQQLA